MNAEIVERADAQVLGITARINPMQANYSELWGQRFGPREPEIAALATEKGYYGVYYMTGQENVVDFVAGMIVGKVPEVPEGLTLRALPGGKYAVFRCTMATIGPTWGQIYGQWLPAAGYVEDEVRPCFEYYTPGEDRPDSLVTIYVAVRRA